MAEPLNLFTNLFFIIAAVLCARAILRTPSEGKQYDLWVLTALLFLIGVGSGLWHGIPMKATVMMDVIPITLFINAYIVFALRRLFDLEWKLVGAWWAASFAASMVGQVVLPPDLLNGTIMYIPTYLTLVVMTLALRKRDRDTGSVFVMALGVWTLSLILRTIDHDICASLSFGTHFLWHTFNAWVLWRLLRVLIDDSGAVTHQR